MACPIGIVTALYRLSLALLAWPCVPSLVSSLREVVLLSQAVQSCHMRDKHDRTKAHTLTCLSSSRSVPRDGFLLVQRPQ